MEIVRSWEGKWGWSGEWGRSVWGGGAGPGSVCRRFVFVLNTMGSNWRISGMSMVGSDLCVETITLVASGDLIGGKQERREEDQWGDGCRGPGEVILHYPRWWWSTRDVQKVKSVGPTNRLFREVRERMTLRFLICTVGRRLVFAIRLLGKIRRDPSLLWVKEQDNEETHEFHLRQTEFKKHSTHQKEILTVQLDIQFWTKCGLEI